jgi:hypothetical protein
MCFSVTSHHPQRRWCDVTLKHVGSFIVFVTLYFNIVYELVVIHVL